MKKKFCLCLLACIISASSVFCQVIDSSLLLSQEDMQWWRDSIGKAGNKSEKIRLTVNNNKFTYPAATH